LTARLLSLAAGTLPPGCSELGTVLTAATAGFALVGLRPDHHRLGSTDAISVRRSVEAEGLEVLDVEVVRLGSTAPETIDQLVLYAAALQARHLLVVSEDSWANTVAGFRRICELAEGTGVRPVLEFMRFTTVPDLDTAVSVVTAAGHPLGGVLVDALHLARSGGLPADVAPMPTALIPYIQVCDVSTASAPPDLANEARHARLLPGRGDLPLSALLRAAPEAVISVEVQSDQGWSAHTPVEWATEARQATLEIISAMGA